ncbi:hypothetical protein ABFS82_03G046500 [Erythranthe guttata]|uniref:Uncharacterized protein n=1 Tax=Erythranthe guttata TaxID=4155 RepID=A0A022QBQ7_ERYGU|nr:PREDICTED: uncharacterized protein LOC105971356 [Erythranthe guttata]EYU25391.1 hypothetical protein MIMGU_mgv1a025423mg [Erythranthe guttata]|eukprot:XP_012851658.1 PREDICTED: uncharacterized protein LOC105971356 [Erythranthe guttata]
MEVMIIPNNLDFDFNSATAPSTPKIGGSYYFSAPASPSHLSHFYRDFDDFFAASGGGDGGSAAVPPPVLVDGDDDADFAFDVSEEWETASLPPADELFHGGVIKPLHEPPPPPRLQQLPAAAMLIKTEADPFTAAAGLQRGRERVLVKPSKSSSRRAARSLSPIRDHTQYQWEEEIKEPPAPAPPPPTNVCSALSASVKVQRKWRLKDFFLFRSASEGRAAEKDPLKRYTAALRHSSFRAIDSPGSRRRGPVSAHELHYTMNRAVSEDLKKKTFLPYKQGILGRLAFNPAVHALANGFGFSRK